ncbi:hypothetical protein C9928_06825, partial [Pseudidiomarina aestuarii]
MIFLITGIPGHGKTLFAVSLIDKLLKKNDDPKQTPRRIFADIDGLDFPNVPLSPPDWRDTPEGSQVFYDECQEDFGPDQGGRSTNPIIQALEKHRHTGHDIYLITQHPKLLHSHIRRLVGRHYHVIRKHGTETAIVYQKDGHIDVDKGWLLPELDNFPFQYPKELFDKYKSATRHTVKAQMPRWLKRSLTFLSIGFVVVLVGGYIAITSIFSPSEAQTISDPEPQSEVVPLTITEPIESAQALRPVACISNQTDCTCYDQSGFKLFIPISKCRS